MPELPFPVGTANSIGELANTFQRYMEDLYQDRIGGASLGDCLTIGSDDVLAVNIDSTTLEKSDSALTVKVNAAGGLTSGTDGLAVKCASGGGLSASAAGLAVSGTYYSFGIIACPAGTNPEADGGGDTLTFAVSKGLTITGTAASDTVTFSVKQQAHEADASASHSITDPGDAPADADALRDDLVTNTIPAIEAALNALGTKVNNILSKLETAEILASA